MANHAFVRFGKAVQGQSLIKLKGTADEIYEILPSPVCAASDASPYIT